MLLVKGTDKSSISEKNKVNILCLIWLLISCEGGSIWTTVVGKLGAETWLLLLAVRVGTTMVVGSCGCTTVGATAAMGITAAIEGCGTTAVGVVGSWTVGMLLRAGGMLLMAGGMLFRADGMLFRAGVMLLRAGVMLLRIGVILLRAGVMLLRAGVLLRTGECLVLRDKSRSSSDLRETSHSSKLL
jgi:hypothetical protein